MKLTARMASTAVAIAIAAAPGAQAATPESGTVSASKAKVAWTGSLNNAWVTWNAWYLDPESPCTNASQCDEFALKVATAGDLTLTAGSDAQYDDGSKPS